MNELGFGCTIFNFIQPRTNAMCYSNSLTSKNIDLKKKYKKEIPSEIAEAPLFHVSGFVFPEWRVITEAPEIQQMKWGLIPSWFKGSNTVEFASKTLNARSETVYEKPSFKNSIGHRHCVIPSTGFYEYQTNGKEKKPFFVFPKTDELFHIAGIYDIYQDPFSGELVKGFSMLTCEANEMMAEIHNSKKRMPIMLGADKVDDWVNRVNGWESLMKGAPSDWFDAHTVNPKVLKGTEHNTVKAMEKYVPLDYTQGSLF